MYLSKDGERLLGHEELAWMAWGWRLGRELAVRTASRQSLLPHRALSARGRLVDG